MSRRKVQLTLVGVVLAFGAAAASITTLRGGPNENHGITLDPSPDDATACELETRRTRGGIWSLRVGPAGNGSWKATFILKSNNSFDAYWYLESSDPPLKDHADQRIFKVTSEPFEMETVATGFPADSTRGIEMQMGKENRSYAFLTREQLDAMSADRPTTGRYPLAASSVITQVNGDNGKGRTHFTRDGTGQAVDLAVDPGTEVLAFGSGSVVFVQDGYDDQLQCGDKHVRRYGNLIAILQDDGYEAIYGHLEMGSSLVSEGMRVEVGQPLARVGQYNGFDANAHLHFQLGGMTEEGLRSVPVAFTSQGLNSMLIPEKGLRIDSFDMDLPTSTHN